MEQRYYSDMLAALANRASLGTVRWLGLPRPSPTVMLRCH